MCACRWHRCSDVFFFCMSLALLLDGRVWPLDDAHKVEQLLGLIYHVTGKSRDSAKLLMVCPLE